jgi:diacylglycerol kinase family enzyme
VSRRVAAVLALLSLLAAAVLAVVHAVSTFPGGLVALVLLVLAAAVSWQGLIRGGRVRTGAWAVAAILLVGAVGALVLDRIQLSGLLVVGFLVAAVGLSKRAFSVHLDLPPAPAPQRAVVVYNIKSGGGKALTNNLAEEARKRGIEPREFQPGEDWEQVVRDLVAQGADGLAAAGGDGTQALVATIAAEHDLPFACIPAGTRNHFALDLGVDRNDVVGALDAFVNGGEKRVDLGEVSGRVFVNNVSLGLYAEAVQNEGYRDAKIRTLLDTVPTMLAPGGGEASHELRWTGPDGTPERSAAVVLVSNNVYRLGRAIGSGTRPRMDSGRLGVAVMGAADAQDGRRHALREWSTPKFVVESDGTVPLGVDGEALVMASPVTFRIRPAALRVRIAPQHPGASPSAVQPDGVGDAVSRLFRIARGADPGELTDSVGPVGQ